MRSACVPVFSPLPFPCQERKKAGRQKVKKEGEKGRITDIKDFSQHSAHCGYAFMGTVAVKRRENVEKGRKMVCDFLLAPFSAVYMYMRSKLEFPLEDRSSSSSPSPLGGLKWSLFGSPALLFFFFFFFSSSAAFLLPGRSKGVIGSYLGSWGEGGRKEGFL